MTSERIQKMLKKAGRTFDVCEDRRQAILYCAICGRKIGQFDLVKTSQEEHLYCSKCIKSFIRETPYNVENLFTVLVDYGDKVIIKYGNSGQIRQRKCCYSTYGRYIKVDNLRCYL